ncbi:MAG TPA: methyltransferase domain-containing protein [Gammaproteobacteria bacterium]|nr:methyltransferase domain-containing protein [Gammaproteobacteria bacterium]
MSANLSRVVRVARDYYNSSDADRFYNDIWGGEDIHIGVYLDADEPIRAASERTVALMAAQIGKLGPETRLIDLGAGYGGAARWLARNSGCHVTCVNLSEIQNDRNRELTAAAGLGDRIRVIDGSFEQIPDEDASYDVAWSQDSILHSGDRARVLDEIDRVLKPGGQVIFTDPMQADDCPPGVLAPVLQRIHLDSLGSIGFYRAGAAERGWKECSVLEMTHQLVRHYTRVREELMARRWQMNHRVSAEYVERMIDGLGHWIAAGQKRHLSWGILHFQTKA